MARVTESVGGHKLWPTGSADRVLLDRTRASLQVAISVGENPWGRVPDVAYTLEELGVADPGVAWDEVEEWGDVIPLRPARRTHAAEFDDLCAAYGVNYRWDEQ